MEAEPRLFYKSARIAEQARTKLQGARQKREPVDYVTFVPDGEPTLDANLGEEIDILKGLKVRVAVISNGSLLWREEVRQNVLKAGWVSLKVDTVNQKTWCRVDRPHQSLKLGAILEGMLKFAETFEGELTTETMLVRGVNDDQGEIKEIAQFLMELKPHKAYVAIPTRPPAERVDPATEQTINTAYQIFAERLRGVEYLIGYEGNAFSCTGNVQEDLLSITSVHPMREEAVAEFLRNAGTGWDTVQDLVEKRDLVELEYRGNKFYMRKLPAHGLSSLQ
jgi:wyosine [tRNA(Phe)-imidazoG37] synthetase (radical SAM superfamily)